MAEPGEGPPQDSQPTVSGEAAKSAAPTAITMTPEIKASLEQNEQKFVQNMLRRITEYSGFERPTRPVDQLALLEAWNDMEGREVSKEYTNYRPETRSGQVPEEEYATIRELYMPEGVVWKLLNNLRSGVDLNEVVPAFQEYSRLIDYSGRIRKPIIPIFFEDLSFYQSYKAGEWEDPDAIIEKFRPPTPAA